MAFYLGAKREVNERLRKDEFQEKSNRREEANLTPLEAKPRPIAIQPKELKKSDKTDVEIPWVKNRDP